MKKLYVALLVFLGLNLTLAQENESMQAEKAERNSSVTRKGRMFVFLGWNRAIFSSSDIHFSGDGYNFQLKKVQAQDKPHPISIDYINPTKFTLPQYNVRIGYFIKDDLALVLGIDHMKYVMKQDQTVNITGHISDPKYAAMVHNGQVNLADEQFLTFEHTDGLNYENLGIEKYQTLSSSKNWDIVWSYGLGAGVMFPKSNVKLFDKERSDRFHVAGMGTDVRTSLNIVFAKHWLFRVEAKGGYINMWDIKTTVNNKPDKANQDFVFGQVLAGIGYTFNTRKAK